MKKKFNHYVSLSLLLLSVLPFSLVSAETIEEVPTGETTISSMADDPLKELKEKAANQVPTIESTPESESVEDTPTSESETKEDVPKTEDTTESKPKPQARGGGIGPQAVNLIEGVDIDAGFAQLLRTSVPGNGLYDVTRPSFTGYGKPVNGLTDDDLASLTYLNVNMTSLTSLEGLEYAINLEELYCGVNSLTTLDVSKCTKLTRLQCTSNKLTNLDITKNTDLKRLQCDQNKLTNLDISQNLKLEHISFSNNSIPTIDVSQHTLLTSLNCEANPIIFLDVSSNVDLESLFCGETNITNIDVSQNLSLDSLSVRQNNMVGLDVSKNLELTYLWCSKSTLKSLDVTNNIKLETLLCDNNFLRELDLSKNIKLKTLDCSYNQLNDITSTYGLNDLTSINAEKQELMYPIPTIISGQMTVDTLRTTAHQGLSAWNGTISGSPIIAINGDKIELSNVTQASMDGGLLNFSYNGSQLTEGASSGTKKFSGVIKFFIASQLTTDLQPKIKKVGSTKEVEWTWTVTCTSFKKAENVRATLALPIGLSIDPMSIEKDGSPATMNDINGTNSLGELNNGESITFKFVTNATGIADEWLEATGRVDWEDDTIASPYYYESKGQVRIKDDEQTYTPKDIYDMAIQSVPVYFNHGTNPIMSTAQTYHLHAMNYQSNTKVVTDGFYTRIKDDRAISTGWKLTAKLSDFKDSSNQPMPNGTGTMLKLENMSIERVTDRDTPQEVIDPTPSGLDVPSVQATETLVAGQSTAKTIVSAQMNEGQDTWQLRMPFDKVSLSIPANAGKKKTVYKANLTWSLDDTP